MAGMKGSIFLHCSVFLLLMTQTAFGQLSNTSGIITPPPGNSPKIIVKTASAYIVYTCVNGAWVAGKGYAKLLDSTTNKVVGNYTKLVDKQGELGTWNIFNSLGDAEESGDSASAVTGRLVASASDGSSSLPDQLMEAASHLNDGAVSLVSYIQKYKTTGGLPPTGKCSTQTYSVTVPFKAEFCLWTQDQLPASVPGDLTAPGRVVQGFFGKGFITYKYTGSGWVDSGKTGTLYTLPGTPAIGSFNATDDVSYWNLWNPNGLVVWGKRTSPEVWVVTTACPWSLSKVTSASGPLMTIGVFTNVQTTSTRGGLPPIMSSSSKLAQGATMTSPFSAIYWYYVKT